jgi:K+-sensing histidine kinase KdpD
MFLRAVLTRAPGSALTRAKAPGQLSIFSAAALSFDILSLHMKSPGANTETDPTRLDGPRRRDLLIGGLICAGSAFGACLMAAGHSWEVSVPLVFSAVVLLTAMRFGARAGIVGTLLATLIFALFLFKPLGKLRVASEAARANLVWMLLMGVVFSFLFAPPPSGVRRS